jgi:hypothetical protein
VLPLVTPAASTLAVRLDAVSYSRGARSPCLARPCVLDLAVEAPARSQICQRCISRWPRRSATTHRRGNLNRRLRPKIATAPRKSDSCALSPVCTTSEAFQWNPVLLVLKSKILCDKKHKLPASVAQTSITPRGVQKSPPVPAAPAQLIRQFQSSQNSGSPNFSAMMIPLSKYASQRAPARWRAALCMVRKLGS